MAYMGRSGGSSAGGGGRRFSGSSNRGDRDGSRSTHHNGRDSGYDNNHHGRFYRAYYYVDSTFFLLQMAFIILILVIGIIVYLSSSQIEDPIADTKNLFMNAYFIALSLILGINVLMYFISEDKAILINRLKIIFVLSFMTMIVFLIIKLNLDATYTSSKFESLYSGESYTPQINLGIGGVTVKTGKSYFVDECVKLYFVFKIKTYVMLGLHLWLNLLLIYQIGSEHKNKAKRDRINKDDLILFDEEQNLRY